MTFWGFLFMVLIVFVAFYAWYRFARRGVNAPRLGGDRHTDIRRANQPLMTETGTIGERSKFKSARPKRHRSAEVQKYLTEVGTIGDAPQAQRRPIAGYLPAPKQDFSTEVGAIGDVQASSTSSAMNQTNTPQQAIVSENVSSNLSQAQLNPNHDPSEWLENSDLERLNNQAEQQEHAYSAVNAVGQQATQDFSTEAGLIGDVAASATYPDQARLGNTRHGYIHQQDVEIGMLDNDSMLAKFPDQLPTLNPRSFKDPDCK